MSNRRILASVLGLCLLAGVVSVARATITDELNPFGSSVFLGLHNPDSVGYTGTVRVKVDLGGPTEIAVVPFSLDPGESTTVTAVFKSEVVAVLSASITEEPILH